MMSNLLSRIIIFRSMGADENTEERGLWSSIFLMIAIGVVGLGTILLITTELGYELRYRGTEMPMVDFHAFLGTCALGVIFYGFSWLADIKRQMRMRKKRKSKE